MTIWAVCNSISRLSLNDPIFDEYHRLIGIFSNIILLFISLFLKILILIGAHTPPNRHELEESYLAQIDEFVIEIIMDELEKAKCISLSNDGWSDICRRAWLGFAFYFISEDWKIICLEPDLIPLSHRSTSEVLHKCVEEEINYWIPNETTVVATATTDGAANEVKAGMSELKLCIVY